MKDMEYNESTERLSPSEYGVTLMDWEADARSTGGKLFGFEASP